MHSQYELRNDYKKDFIEFMVRCGVLTFGDFTTKSGRKTSYFINTGNYMTGGQARQLGKFYADCVMENIKAGNIKEDFTAFFGPAYKGIPLVVATSIAFSNDYGRDLYYCFNRKEVKDHGEGGEMVGYGLKDGDRVLIIEDVITAGTAIRETLPILQAQADITVEGLIISVDRMEKGRGEKTAIQEIYEEFGIRTFSIVNVREIIGTLHNKPIDGRIVINDEVRKKMEQAL